MTPNEEEIQRLAAEAEAGYDPEVLAAQRQPSPRRRKPRPLERKVPPQPKPTPVRWPITIYVCNVCHQVMSHELICTGEFEPVEVAPVGWNS